MNKNSFVYQELTQPEITAVMAGVFPNEPVEAYSLLTGGLFNTTYRVITSEHDVVLRMGPVRQELLLPYEHHLMEAERETDRLCLEQGIPVSNVLHLDTSRTIANRDFMVVERIESQPLSNSEIPSEARQKLHTDCGKMLRKIHEITGTQFGRLSDIVSGSGYPSWYEAVYDEFVKIFRTARPYSIFPQELEEKAFAMVRQCKPLLDRITIPHLAHCDLWDGNILVREDQGEYEICAIIDGDRAMFGDTDLDIAQFWRHNPDFMKGYGTPPSVFTDAELQKKRDLYSLMLDLNDAYVWIIEYDNRVSYERRLQSARNTLNMK